MEDELDDGSTAGSGVDGVDGPGTPSDLEDVAGPLANASSRRLLINFATGYLGLAVAMILSLFLTPITLHYLGTSTYGLWVVITSIGSYIGVLDAGVATAASRMIASATAVHDDARVAEILATARSFFRITGLVGIGVIAAFVPLLGSVFGVGTQSLTAARIALILTGLTTAVGFLASVPQCGIFGIGRNDRAAFLGISLTVIGQGGSIVVVLLGGGIVGLLAVTLAAAVLGYAVAVRISRKLGLPGRGRGHSSRAMMSELFRSGRRNAVVGLGGTISYQIDAVVVGAVLTVRQVAAYDLGLSTGNFVRSAATAATNLLLPAYAHSSTLDDKERQFRLYSRAVLASLCITAPMAVALMAFGEPLLRLWLGHVPSHTFQVLVAINIVLLLQLPGHQSFIFLTGIGRNQTLARISLPAAVVNLGLSIGAAYWLGPVGPAVGSLPQVIILDLVILPIMCCRSMGIAVTRYLREATLPVVVPLIGAIGAALILRGIFGDSSTYWSPVEAVAVTLVAWAVLVPALMRTDPIVNRLVHQARNQLLAKLHHRTPDGLA